MSQNAYRIDLESGTVTPPNLDSPRPPGETYEKMQARMDAAFDLVKNKEHWKNPIDAIIDAVDEARVREAVRYFTGSEAHFVVEGEGKLRVKADGYYRAIGA